MLIRQGDLALVPSTAPTVGGDPKVLDLAIGEDSGHAHTITGVRVDNLLSLTESADLIVTPAPSAWRHDAITVPAGTYDVRVQREYTPAGARRVAD